MTTYAIVRFFQDSGLDRETIDTGLSLDEAQDHCNDPETSSSTCEGEEGTERTERYGPWFDGYEEE